MWIHFNMFDGKGVEPPKGSKPNAFKVLKEPYLIQFCSKIHDPSTCIPTLTTEHIECDFKGPCGYGLIIENGSRALATACCSL